MEKIQNENPNSDFHLACCLCDSREKVSMVAHRNKEMHIKGFLVCCDKCFPDMQNKRVEVIDADS